MWWYSMYIASILCGTSGGVALGFISLYSPLELSKRMSTLLALWAFPGALVGIGLAPSIGHGVVGELFKFSPAIAWVLALGLTLKILRWRYPGIEKGQYILPL